MNELIFPRRVTPHQSETIHWLGFYGNGSLLMDINYTLIRKYTFV